MDDLIKYEVIQKAFYGGNVVEYDFQNAKKYNLPTDVKNFNGVLLERLDKEGPAADAGLKPGDVIIRVNNTPINSKSEFEEYLAYRYPGDKISLTYLRNNKENTSQLTLVNRIGTTEIIKRKIYLSSTLEAQF
ncbi:MAG: PDZ domain-containing protein [Flammeovirgaceae bacterium]|nr:PDZ domain-containing protein [Flammeovirgaceae bacterium]